jgi:lipopolysaccharide export system permease protein
MLVTRYLFKNLFNATVFIAVTLTLVIWLTQSLKLLELVANSDAPPVLFIKLVAMTLPKFLEIILPLSLAIAVIFTYNRLIMDNEIIVMRACGIDHYALARPAVGLAIAASLLLTFISVWVSPRCYAEVQEMRQALRTQYSAFLLREGVFNTFGSGLTIYMRARNGSGDMAGLMIFDSREKDKPPVTITAKSGRVEMNGDVPSIIVSDGMRQQLDPGTGSLSKLYFSRYTIEIKGLEGAAEERWKKPGERTWSELTNPDPTDKRDRAAASAFTVEAHERLVTPWNALSFTLASLAALLLGPFNRRGQHVKIIAAGGIAILLQALSLSFANIARQHLGALPLLYITTFLPVLLAAWFLHLRGEQMLKGLLRRWNARQRKSAGGAPA